MATAEMTAPPAQARPALRLQLTESQKQLILRTVAELITAGSLDPPVLSGILRICETLMCAVSSGKDSTPRTVRTQAQLL